MANLTANTVHETQPRAGRHSYVIKNGITIGIGALVQLDDHASTGGVLNHWDEDGYFLGIMVGGADPNNDGVITGDTTATPKLEGYVDESGVTLMHINVTGGTQALVGEAVYCGDSDPASCTMTATSDKPPVGRLVRFNGAATDCDVQLFTPAEHLAGIASDVWV